MSSIIPIPRVELSIRPATLADVSFMDALQKKHSNALGYFPTKQFEEYVESGGVLIAEGRVAGCRLSVAGEEGATRADSSPPLPAIGNSQLATSLGYILSRDRYLKRDELGVIYQLCVAPGTQRKLVGAALVREVFARSAYGCRLYCCWCAQDLEANHFWESMGFVPVAFRAGSSGKKRACGRRGRLHIFWQRRIRTDDAATPYWYPFQTCSGAIRADRLVFPIPPGVHWKDVQAVELPTAGVPTAGVPTAGELPRGSGVGVGVSGERRKRLACASSRSVVPARSRPIPDARNPKKVGIVVGGRIKYIDRPGHDAHAASGHPAGGDVAGAKKVVKPKRPAEKIDAKYLAAARELRDRWLEWANGAGGAQALGGGGRYDVSCALPAPRTGPRAGRGNPMLPPMLPDAMAA